MARTGRRPGPNTTREAILAAAQHQFAADGFDAATIRGIAAEAGVDPALVHHYYGTKRHLFAAAVELPVDLPALVAQLVTGPASTVGERLLRTFLSVWDTPPGRSRMLGMLRSVVTDEHAARMFREFLLDAVAIPLADAVAPDAHRLRATLVASQLLGLATVRYVIALEPLASTEPDLVVAAIGPTLQRYLTGELLCGDDQGPAPSP